MALVSMRQLLDHAAEFGYGIPAFNIYNPERTQAIMQAASEIDSPVSLDIMGERYASAELAPVVH